MSHQIHTTEAIVLDQKDFGEANRWCFLLTPDFGLVVARAQGVRELKSKLNGHLSLFVHAQITLVRGREYWRLIGAEETPQAETFLRSSEKIPRPFGKFPLAPLRAQARVAGLLRRLLPEAGADPELFSLVKQGFNKIAAIPGDSKIIHLEEVLLVWHILRLLGHIEYPNKEVKRLETGQVSDEQLLNLTTEINRALSHTQL
jgi:DNA repair protein RecO (recombination protein O)